MTRRVRGRITYRGRRGRTRGAIAHGAGRVTARRMAWAVPVLVVAVLAGSVLIAFRGEFLTPNFFSDGFLIQDIAQGERTAGPSYTAIGLFYRVLGLADSPLQASFFGYAVMIALVGIATAISRGREISNLAVVTAGAITVLAGSIYVAWYSKDVAVAAIVTLALLIAPRGWLGELLAVSAMGVYAALFRNEFIGVIGLYIALRAMTARKVLSVRRWVVMVLLASVAFSFAIVVLLGGSPSGARDSVNEGRDVNTQISDFVGWPDPLGGVVNNLLTTVALVVPVPLALTGLFYALIAVAVFALWVLFLQAIDRSRGVGEQPRLIVRTACLLAAMLAAQGAAEPDYGSAIRHLTPLMPLIVASIGLSYPLRQPSSGSSRTTTAVLTADNRAEAVQ